MKSYCFLKLVEGLVRPEKTYRQEPEHTWILETQERGWKIETQHISNFKFQIFNSQTRENFEKTQKPRNFPRKFFKELKSYFQYLTIFNIFIN